MEVGAVAQTDSGPRCPTRARGVCRRQSRRTCPVCHVRRADHWGHSTRNAGRRPSGSPRSTSLGPSVNGGWGGSSVTPGRGCTFAIGARGGARAASHPPSAGATRLRRLGHATEDAGGHQSLSLRPASLSPAARNDWGDTPGLRDPRLRILAHQAQHFVGKLLTQDSFSKSLVFRS